MKDLDGEVLDVEVVSKQPELESYSAEKYYDQDNFYPMIGDVVPMVATNAAQNTGDYFDQDNFYPIDGVKVDQDGNWTDVEFSDAIGDGYRNLVKGARNVTSNVGSFFSPEETKRRRLARSEKKSAKIEEAKSRAELNRNVGKETESDKALAEALKSSQTPTKTEGMSKTTKGLLIGGGVLVAVVIGVLVYRSVKKGGK